MHWLFNNVPCARSSMPVWEHLFDQQVLRACPRIQGSLRIVLSFLPGLVFCAHYPLQLALALFIQRQSLRRLCVKQVSYHSADTFSKPPPENYEFQVPTSSAQILAQRCARLRRRKLCQ